MFVAEVLEGGLNVARVFLVGATGSVLQDLGIQAELLGARSEDRRGKLVGCGSGVALVRGLVVWLAHVGLLEDLEKRGVSLLLEHDLLLLDALPQLQLPFWPLLP